MKRVELDVEIDAPIDRIWGILTDPEGFPRWITGMQTVELLTEDDYGVGTQYHVTAGRSNRTVEWTVEITDLEIPHRIEYNYGGDVEGKGGWLIAPAETTNVFRVTSFDEFSPPGGWLVRLLSRFWLDNAARAARRESLERLKEILEGPDGTGEPSDE
jgi:uncharacterized membrane protein